MNFVIRRFIYLFVFLPLLSKSQKQGNIWYFGAQAGLDFNYTPPSPLLNGQTYPYPLGWSEGSTSISDSSGSLLFYSNGMKVWDKLQSIMPHGDSLMGNASSTQSSIIVPQPGSSRYFYLFTTDAQENNFQNGLRYSIIDICLNNGNGDVVVAQKNIKLLDTVAEKLICVKHSNGIDYWIITHKLNSNVFYAYQLTGTGITNVIISSTSIPDANGVGQMAASTNGQKIAYAICSALTSAKCFLADFDPSTGMVSNEQILSSGARVYGLAFSSDNSKLYCSANGIGEVYQYDLNSGGLSAIIASQNYLVQNGPDGWRQMQLGPDGNIYLSRSNKFFLSQISFADSIYPKCNYIDSAIYLGGKKTSFGLPNFVSGYDYSNTSHNCTTPVQNTLTVENIFVFPNPTTSSFSINSTREYQNISVYNSLGELVYECKKAVQNNKTDISTQPSGIYFCKVRFDNGEKVMKIIKID